MVYSLVRQLNCVEGTREQIINHRGMTMNKTRIRMGMLGRFLLDQDHVMQLDLEDEERRCRIDCAMKTNKSLRQLNDELDIQIEIGRKMLEGIRHE